MTAQEFLGAGAAGRVPVSPTSPLPVALFDAGGSGLPGDSAATGIPPHDRQELAYDGNGNLETITYKQGGAGGTVVAVQTLSYDGNGNLTAVDTVVN